MLFSVTAKEKVWGERRGSGNFDRQCGIAAWVTGRKLGFRHPLLESSPSNQLCKHLGLTSSGTIIWEFAKKPEPVIQFLFTPPSFPATGAPDFPNGPRAGPAGLGGVTGPELFLCGLMPGGASLSPGFYYRRCRFQEGMPSLPASPSKFLCWLLLRIGITTIPWVDGSQDASVPCEFLGTREVPWGCVYSRSAYII